MNKQKSWQILLLLLIFSLVLVACQDEGAATTEPHATEATESETEPTEPAAEDSTGGFQIPDIEEGKFNVAMVLIGPHDDGG